MLKNILCYQLLIPPKLYGVGDKYHLVRKTPGLIGTGFVPGLSGAGHPPSNKSNEEDWMPGLLAPAQPTVLPGSPLPSEYGTYKTVKARFWSKVSGGRLVPALLKSGWGKHDKRKSIE